MKCPFQVVAALALLSLTSAAPLAQANPIVLAVTVDTSALVGNPAGPFSLDFQLIDGGGLVTDTAILSAFDFGIGAPSGVPTLTGGAAGDLATVVTLTDAGPSFLNEFTQAFTAGSALRFTVSLTTDAEPGGIPDEFSMGILDASGVGIPTSFFDVFFSVSIDSPLAIQTFASSDPSMSVPAPVVGRVPEPSAMMLIPCALVAARWTRRTRRIKE